MVQLKIYSITLLDKTLTSLSVQYTTLLSHDVLGSVLSIVYTERLFLICNIMSSWTCLLVSTSSSA